VTFDGTYYRVDDLPPMPRPVQPGGPPILIGATRRRMLQLAARYADIIGLEDHQFAERATSSPTVTAADCAEQVAIVRAAAGARFDDIELNVFAARVAVTDAQQASFAALAAELDLPLEVVRASPSFLVGSVEAIVDQLQERRERLGVSYIMVFDRVMDAFAPVVARLAGT
jgi:alkanesulfonate monooxygenase SsuD/methylene tetrahydromethanopterin reductase-like flavin-dependent oxidoreductase (luciferase family)